MKDLNFCFNARTVFSIADCYAFFLRMLSEFAVLYFKVAFTGVIFFSRDLAVIVVSRSYMDLDVFVHS